MNKNLNYLIVGLGLMGGSVGKMLSSKGFNVYGYDINQDSINYGYQNGLIKNNQIDDQLIKDADVIILGLYPAIMVTWIKEHKHLFKKNVIVTDLTGIKGNIVPSIQNELRRIGEFISLHPMCGKETSGVQYSNTEMFKQANLIIVPTENNTQKSIDFARDFGEDLEFNNIEILSIKEHDKMISFLSQLPHVIAVALMNSHESDSLVRYTGDSFRDLTRIAKINPYLWSELFIMNKDNLINDIDQFINMMELLKVAISNEDTSTLHELFTESKKRRENFDKK